MPDNMRVDEIRNILTGATARYGESADIEFKSARGGMPVSLWESYSAFANTNGGTIVLGIRQKGHAFELDGLTEDVVVQYKTGILRTTRGK